jgi:hypothetical protein
MIVLKATNQDGLEEITVEHEVKNEGKVTEEHHFRLRKDNDQRIIYFVMGRDTARELRRHIR